MAEHEGVLIADVVGHHVGGDHAEDVVVDVIGDEGLAADQADFLAVEGDEANGVLGFIL